jgi:hypothetical protein
MRFQKNSLFFSKLIGKEWVLLKQESSYCYKLNETAGFLWQKLDKPRNSEELLKFIKDIYEIEDIQAKKDINGFIKNGLKHGFILLKS